MNANQFFCKNKDRWKKVSETPGINGIDYLEVSSPDQKTLTVYFLHSLIESPVANPPLTPDNIFIEGGVRVKNINVISAAVAGNKLTIVVDKAGDFSTYTLKVGSSSLDADTPPSGFDQQLSSIDFSFKINCPSEFDCKTDNTCPPDKLDGPVIDYLAKDFSSFNRLMLDRLSVIAPGWKERNAADLQIALIELLAYIGDHLSYYQDAVATEAYIATMRRRISARRHARLLDYIAHDGCNARVWVQIQTGQKSIVIPQSTMLMASSTDKLIVDQDEAEKLLRETDSVAFETMHDITMYSTQNQVSFYTWWDSNCCLPAGSTSATLLNEPELFLAEGDVLIFEEIRSPVTGAEADADPNHRCAVRLTSVNKNIDKLTNLNVLDIAWYPGDALPFALCLTTTNSDGGQFEISVARGNIVLADYGATQNNKQLSPAAANGQKYYPMLADKNVTTIVAYDHNTEKTNPASVTILQDPHKALPTVRLSYQQQTWQAQKDLLSSDKFATEFVVETESDGTSYLRFGDGISGRKPDNGFSPDAKYRVGNGNDGNVGPEAINTIVWGQGGIINVRNPLPASGGTEAETIEQIRQYAPQAFRTQERAVVESDYVEKAKLHPEVQNAAARFYWTGSWYTVYLIIDRLGGNDIDEDFKQELVVLLDQYRMAGYDLEIIQPTFVPLNIALSVCIKPGYFQADVKQGLLQVFSNSVLPDGTKGFFHPDNFTFGQPVYLSAIYTAALAVDGVSSVEIQTFQRWAKNPDDEIKNGLIKASALEILRLDNDQSLPENGKIDFIMLNGL